MKGDTVVCRFGSGAPWQGARLILSNVTRWRAGIPRGIAVLPVVLACTGIAHAVGPNNALNDTGIVLFTNNSSNTLQAEPPAFPRQDASQGRDRAAIAGTLSKVDHGPKGFDFTQIANDGSPLPYGANPGTGAGDWGCNVDNATGLMWEVKVNDATHLRHIDWSYTWYNATAAVNGGDAGTADGGTCLSAGRCDTEKYVADVNAAGMCGHSDWRLPTQGELHSIVDLSIGYPGPTVDPGYFPNSGQIQTGTLPFWSGAPHSGYTNIAWVVDFGNGSVTGSEKRMPSRVRLVRAGQ